VRHLAGSLLALAATACFDAAISGGPIRKTAPQPHREPHPPNSPCQASPSNSTSGFAEPPPSPGGSPGTILPARDDKTPGQQALWITFTRPVRLKGTLVRLCRPLAVN